MMTLPPPTIRIAAAIALAAASFAAREARANPVRITVTNELDSGGVFFTPVWMGLHDGTFDTYNAGETLNPDFSFAERLVEEGFTDTITSAFAASNPGGLQGTLLSAGAPPFGPGESASMDFSVTDPTSQRYLSYMSMIVPSNDLFFGNDDPTEYELFDASGNFNGPVTILVLGQDVYDAGTEANDPNDGGAFIAGVDMALGTTTSDPVTRFLVLPGSGADLDELIGLVTASGDTISLPFTNTSVIASISVQVIPEPSTILLVSMGVGAIGASGIVRRRRRRAALGG